MSSSTYSSQLATDASLFSQIKVMCGGGVASATDAIETIQYSAEEIQAITTTCRQMGNIHTTAHAYVGPLVSLLLPARFLTSYSHRPSRRSDTRLTTASRVSSTAT